MTFLKNANTQAVDTSSFDKNLSPADDTVQKAFNTLDELTAGISLTGNEGDLIVRGPSDWENQTPGTAGYYYQSQGPGTEPLWVPGVVASGGGDLYGPGSSTNNNIPQWNGVSGQYLKDGLLPVTTVGNPGADTSIPTEQAVREGLNEKVIAPTGSTTTNKIPQWDTTSKKLKDGLGLATAIATPGVDTNVPTEKAVRDTLGGYLATPSGTVTGGDVLYHDGLALQYLPPDTDGKVLTTHGPGNAPSWEEGGGGDSGPLSSVTILSISAGEVDIDASTANGVLTLTADGNFTLNVPTGVPANKVFRADLVITQDGSGNRVLTLHASWKTSGGSNIVLSSGIGDIDWLVVYSDGTNHFIGMAGGDMS